MTLPFIRLLFRIEDRHFWFRARNQVITTLVRQVTARMKPGYRVLEVGCGTGNVLRALEATCAGGTVVGMDLFEEGLRYARCRTSCALVQGDIHSPPFGLGVDLIGIFDVLEHLPDDLQALRDLRDMLVDGGALLLTVPANKSLWSYFDDASHYYRRYSLTELENKLTRAGYSIEYASHYMASIFLPVWLGRRLQSLRDRRPAGDSDRIHDLASAELRITPLVNGLLTFVLGQEAKVISRRRRLPIGTSLIALARKVTRQAPK
jgi:SAM-dependent methyltransferase